MTADPDFAATAVLLADPSRAAMLARLLDGRSWTASELAKAARVSKATASSHLGKLLRAGWLVVHPQGRLRYYRLASSDIAARLEALAGWSPPARAQTPGERRASASLRRCRLCYDHLAGRIGVALHEQLTSRGLVVERDGQVALAAAGHSWLRSIGLEIDETVGRPCMDWSERRLHLAGPLGSALARGAITAGWLLRQPRSRALSISPRGATALARDFEIDQPLRLEE